MQLGVLLHAHKFWIQFLNSSLLLPFNSANVKYVTTAGCTCNILLAFYEVKLFTQYNGNTLVSLLHDLKIYKLFIFNNLMAYNHLVKLEKVEKLDKGLLAAKILKKNMV